VHAADTATSSPTHLFRHGQLSKVTEAEQFGLFLAKRQDLWGEEGALFVCVCACVRACTPCLCVQVQDHDLLICVYKSAGP